MCRAVYRRGSQPLKPQPSLPFWNWAPGPEQMPQGRAQQPEDERAETAGPYRPSLLFWPQVPLASVPAGQVKPAPVLPLIGALGEPTTAEPEQTPHGKAQLLEPQSSFEVHRPVMN